MIKNSLKHSLNADSLSHDEFKKNFDAIFQPICELLELENNDLIRQACTFARDLLYFNAKFKSLCKTKCRETLIDNYLEYINKYLLDTITEKNICDTSIMDKITFNFLNEDVEILKKINDYKIEFIPAGKYLDFSKKYSGFYLLCYNEDLKRENHDLWNKKLNELCEKSKNFTCAILNYKQHNNLNGNIISENVFDKQLDLIIIQDRKVTNHIESVNIIKLDSLILTDHVQIKHLLTLCEFPLNQK